GAEAGLGYPTGPMTCTGGGCGQPFEIGEVVWSAATGTHLVRGGIHQAWVAAGRGSGWLGAPAAEMVCGQLRGGCVQSFQYGALYWSPATGAHGVAGGIRGYWAARGAEAGLGYPTGPMTCTGGGCGQPFEIGEVVWSAATGTHLVRGGIHQTWVANGGGGGSLGYPLTEMVCGLARSGCAQHFEHGSVYWSPATLGFAVSGAIRDHWRAQSAERGALGYPTSTSRAVAGGVAQDFQGGTLTYDSGTGAVTRS
ncbi:LGFP repeat-containing protein, partial [Blastococcus sp. SYSU D00922]